LVEMDGSQHGLKGTGQDARLLWATVILLTRVRSRMRELTLSVSHHMEDRLLPLKQTVRQPLHLAEAIGRRAHIWITCGTSSV
jgi:hypothetical protein